MKKFITYLAMLAIAGIASADIVTYDTFTGTTVTGGNNTQTIALDSGHTWIDNNSGSATTAPMYFGGTIQVSRTDNEVWQNYFSFGVNSSADAKGAYLVDYAGSTFSTEFDGTQASAVVTELAGQNVSETAFQIKIVDTAWNQAEIQLFIGANAVTATEGTADYTAVFTGVTANEVNQFYVMANAGAGQTTTVTLGGLGSNSGIASSTEWIAVPEPATVGMLGLGALVALMIRRIRA